MAPKQSYSNIDNAVINSTVRVKIPTTMCNKNLNLQKNKDFLKFVKDFHTFLHQYS